jgi:hypothetical protein
MGDISVLDVDSLLDDITGPKPPDALADDPAGASPLSVDIPPTEGHRWALDCYWAYENMGGRPNKAKAGTPARLALWSMANKDPGAFVMDIMPRAMALLDKARAKSSDGDMVVRKENKKIAELQEILRGAIEESRYV